jgi:nucleotide-binding universal stress UspA family protein
MYDKLLIPLDGSRPGEAVLRYVDVLQCGARVPIELVTAIDITAITSHLAAEKARFLHELIAGAEDASQDYLRRIAARLKSFDVSCTVRQGKAADVILECAMSTPQTLIAMATHGRSGLQRWLLGSIAEKVLRGTRNPLFLVRSTDGDPLQRWASLSSIIAPLDGSALAASVLPTVTQLAKRLAVGVVLFRAFELPAKAYYGKEDFLPNYGELTNQIRAEAQAYLDERAAELRTNEVPSIVTVVSEGLPADEILRCTTDYPKSILVMCTHGRSGVRRWMIGSVTETVVRHSSDPVLVLRAP